MPAARGRVFLIDNRRDPSRAAQDPYIVDEADDVQRRRLTDGSEHRVVKVFYEPDELAERLGAAGLGRRSGRDIAVHLRIAAVEKP